MSYLPIEDYGLIGNMHSAALVGRNGSIDWLCLPHFDSPSVFAALLDNKKGGHFRISPAPEGGTCRQMYFPDTNVLLTRFLLESGVVEVIDYMPVGIERGDRGFRQLVRRIEAVRGSVPLRVECYPAFNYARDDHRVDISEHGAVFRSEKMDLELTTRVPLRLNPTRGGVEAMLQLRQGERATLALRQLDEKHTSGRLLEDGAEQALFEQTVAFWHGWLGKCTYKGRWREMIYRSALALKLLTFEPTGALVAAPTTSLPEAIGGHRNWDYRYTWVRDSSFSLYSLLRLGFTEEASAFMRWLEQRCHERKPDGGLQIMYGLHGEHELKEETLDHLEGYMGSRPVRIGNAAAEQLQLDIYGELMDSVYLYNKHAEPVSWDLWVELSELVDWVCEHWKQPDEGIWETRGGRKQFVYSKVMCWVAIDRAIRVASQRGLPANWDRWMRCRNDIYQTVMANGWSARRQAFVQHFDSDTLDAANLVLPLVFFVGPNDPRMLKTLDAICKDPSDGGLLSNSLVHRYDTDRFHDGLEGTEGTFNMCTFWLVEALTHAGRTDRARLRQARLMFEKMLSYASPLGLFAEQTGVRGEALGNFPQAFTHLALIGAAHNLDDALNRRE